RHSGVRWMTTTGQRQTELTVPMVTDIESAATRAAGNMARELGMNSEKVDEMMHAVIEACINAREHGYCADNRIYLRFVGTSHGEGRRIDVWVTDRGKGFDPDDEGSRRAAPGTAHKRGRELQRLEASVREAACSPE